MRLNIIDTPEREALAIGVIEDLEQQLEYIRDLQATFGITVDGPLARDLQYRVKLAKSQLRQDTSFMRQQKRR